MMRSPACVRTKWSKIMRESENSARALGLPLRAFNAAEMAKILDKIT